MLLDCRCAQKYRTSMQTPPAHSRMCKHRCLHLCLVYVSVSMSRSISSSPLFSSSFSAAVTGSKLLPTFDMIRGVPWKHMLGLRRVILTAVLHSLHPKEVSQALTHQVELQAVLHSLRSKDVSANYSLQCITRLEIWIQRVKI